MKRVKFVEGNELHFHHAGHFFHFKAFEVQDIANDATADLLIGTGWFAATTEPVTYPGPELETETIDKSKAETKAETKAAPAAPVQVPAKPKAGKKAKE